MKPREQILAIGLAISLVCGLVLSGWNRSSNRSVDPLKMWQSRYAAALESQARLEADAAWLEVESSRALSGEPSRSQLVYQNALFELLKTLGIENATVIPAAVTPLHENVSSLSMQVEFESSSAELAQCLAASESAELWQRITQLSTESLPDDRLRVRMLWEVLLQTDRPNREQLVLEAANDETDAANRLAGLFPTTETPEPSPPVAPTQAPAVPPVNPADDLILIALLGTPQHPEAWLYDRRRKSHRVLLTSAEIACGSFQGNIEGFSADGLLVTSRHGRGLWPLGRRLSDLKLELAPQPSLSDR
jgi:hypothetical protein